MSTNVETSINYSTVTAVTADRHSIADTVDTDCLTCSCEKMLNVCYETSQLMLCKEINAVCSEIHKKHINTLCEQNVEFVNLKLVVHIVTTGL